MTAPAGWLPRFRAARKRLAELEAREKFDGARMRAFQHCRLNDLWAHAASNVPHYRRLMAAHRLPPKFDSLEQFTQVMPVLAKEAIRSRPEDFLSPLAGSGHWRSTSGSTGTPMRFFASTKTHQAILCYQYRFRQHWGLGLFDRAAFLNGRPGTLKDAAIDRLRGRIRIPVHQMGRKELAAQLDRIRRFNPAYIYGYSRAIYLLALEAAERDFRCDSLRVVMMTSEPAFAHMVAAVEQAFGVPAAVEYGSTECGVTAYEWRDRRLRVRSDHVLMETIPRADRRFDIVKTVLDNFDFPLLRYRIEDVTDAPLDAVDHAFPVLHNVGGRNDDLLCAGDGSAVHPAEIDAIFERAQRPAVRRYRLHQAVDGDVSVRVEPAGDAPIDLAEIEAAISRVVPGRRIHAERVGQIEQTAGGKHRLITSDCRPKSSC